jgi:hypothetical protein
MEILKEYDVAIMWNWEYDRQFVELIHKFAHQHDITVLDIQSENVESTFNLYKKNKIQFRYLFDRASDEDERFQPFARYVLKQFRSEDNPSTYFINPQDLQCHAADKATMHLEFLAHGIDVPYTIIISPFNHKNEIELSLTELAKLGRQFIIKPANTTGGGVGVVTGAESLKQIIDARQLHKNDKYLLQETIRPIEIDGRRAWFRVFFAFGEIIPCWWNDSTHIYSLLSDLQEHRLGLKQLRDITNRIQVINKLDFFSTELVCTADEKCVAVDYVNEICDMRLQSQYPDGVPDSVVHRIINELFEYIKKGRNTLVQ